MGCEERFEVTQQQIVRQVTEQRRPGQRQRQLVAIWERMRIDLFRS
jgi:hypothetical protein